MKISLNWLKDYLSTNLEINQLSEILTDIGLEVEGVEKFERVKGGLEGVVIGQIVEVSPHPNADRLQLTKVDVGHAEHLHIVCGAPNVAKGQKVVVALVGAVLYPDEKGFEIKKSKIRGEVSEGMLCAEDELGLGDSHDGIMVLEEKAVVGQKASEYFGLESDTVIEIGLTPNRVDAASHYGVARDLAVYLNLEHQVELKLPALDKFSSKGKEELKVSVQDSSLCPRYSAIAFKNVKVKPSPNWLQNRLNAIGVKPINNVVDITNYVLHEIGQPLHAFDREKIQGNEVQVKRLKAGTVFTTLDGVERKLDADDLMICNAKNPMCIAGVFGGIESGVSENTREVFLESAYFNPTSIRKTAKRHGLNTDASFRYERGADPEITVFALRRASKLIQEIASGEVASELFDFYPEPIEPFLVDFNYENCDRLLGQKIDRKTIKAIFEGLDIRILNESKGQLRLAVPSYRVDVQREVDLIEEVLRIYGYNRIALPDYMRSNVPVSKAKDNHLIENSIANYLASNSLSEIFTNSLSNPAYYQDDSDLVEMLNPLSSELKVLRKSMLFGGLESMAYNLNRQKKNLKFFEFGHTYTKSGESKYAEKKCLSILMTGNDQEESWREEAKSLNFFDLKELLENCFERLGLKKWKLEESDHREEFDNSVCFKYGKRRLADIGWVSEQNLKKFDIDQPVLFAEINWTEILQVLGHTDVQYAPLSKFPMVRRDLALLIQEEVSFGEIKRIAKNGLKQYLKQVNLFDVYQGKNLPEGKKSYGVSFMLQDETKTLSDKQIDGMMDRLINSLKTELNAELR